MNGSHRIEAQIRSELLNSLTSHVDSLTNRDTFEMVHGVINQVLDEIGTELAKKYKGRAHVLLKDKLPKEEDEPLHRLGQSVNQLEE